MFIFRFVRVFMSYVVGISKIGSGGCSFFEVVVRMFFLLCFFYFTVWSLGLRGIDRFRFLVREVLVNWRATWGLGIGLGRFDFFLGVCRLYFFGFWEDRGEVLWGFGFRVCFREWFFFYREVGVLVMILILFFLEEVGLFGC